MNYGVILIMMIFCHIVDDFYLQGVLAKLKQKSWWSSQFIFHKEASPKDYKYRYDYIVGLIMHSFSWAFMISLPILWACAWQPTWVFFLVFACNMVIHAIVDHLKANIKCINLIVDQSIHITQIIATLIILILTKLI